MYKNGRIINGVERPSNHKQLPQAEREMEEEKNPNKFILIFYINKI
jgi:hypothetical protein